MQVQQMQQAQQQQMQMLQAQQMQQQMQSMPIGANPQLFPQPGGGRGVGAGGPGFQQSPNLQGPLAYLEKTASNIGEPPAVRDSIHRNGISFAVPSIINRLFIFLFFYLQT